MQQVDVAIIGGGPAGISTALSLLRLDRGWRERMLVLEKEIHPRHKLCGGALTRFGLDQLRRLGLRLDIPFAYVESATFEYRGRVVDVKGAPALAVTQREEFDAWLAGQARQRGVQLLERHPVEDLERVPDGVLIQAGGVRFVAKAIVGADGSRGVVRPWMKARERPPRVARLLEVVTPATGMEGLFTRGRAHFDFGLVREDLQGYFWDFPSLVGGSPRLNRGVYDARVAPSRARAQLPRLLTTRLDESDEANSNGPFEAHPIHLFSPRNTFSAPRALLVGDAAGSDPLFGEGIGVALGFGEIAAEALESAFRSGDFSFGDYRRRVLTSPLGRYLLLRWSVAWWAYRLSGSDLYMRGLWKLGRLLARVYGPYPPVPDVLPVLVNREA